MAPELEAVKANQLSDFMKHTYMKYYGKEFKGEKDKKLLLTLNDKKEYVCHVSALNMYLEHGLKLQKVHRVAQFNQSPWLKQYIDFNTEKRQNAANDSEKGPF
jgi:hypothetical protein